MAISYDRPVEDLIAGLDATGHVTHSKWRKTSVTFHHNGGRLSHQGVLNVWKVRPASAHFDVDARGAVAQYVRVHEYAWATGNTTGNQRSISIEMCNSTLAPDWDVSPTTWGAGARLAGWLFAHIIHAEPTKGTVLFHHDWLPTLCAGPHMDAVRAELFNAVHAAYVDFTGHTPPKPTPAGKLTVDGYLGRASITRWQEVMGTTADGVITPGGSQLVEAVQRFLNAKGARDENGNRLVVDGICDLDNTAHATRRQHTTAALERYLGTTVDAYLSSPSRCVEALQRRLNKATTGSKEF